MLIDSSSCRYPTIPRPTIPSPVVFPVYLWFHSSMLKRSPERIAADGGPACSALRRRLLCANEGARRVLDRFFDDSPIQEMSCRLSPKTLLLMEGYIDPGQHDW